MTMITPDNPIGLHERHCTVCGATRRASTSDPASAPMHNALGPDGHAIGPCCSRECIATAIERARPAPPGTCPQGTCAPRTD